MRISAAQLNSGTTRPQGRDEAGFCRRALRAFTLIEVLVTITIFAILLAAINGLLFGAIRLQSKANEAIDNVLPVDRVTTIVKRDVMNMLFETNGMICGGVYGGTYTGDGNNNLPLAGLASPVNLSFYTTTAIIDDDNYWGEIQRVDYSLQMASNRLSPGMDLVRTVTHNPLTLSQETPEQQRLLQNVQTLTVTFFDTTNWNDSWGDPSSVTASNIIPTAIRFHVDFAGTRDSAPAAPLELLFPIPISLINTNLP